MDQIAKPKLVLPNKEGKAETITLECNGSVVIVGANGSGKSRLGVWIEQNSPKEQLVHRIPAQKDINIPDYAQLIAPEKAENILLWGTDNEKQASKQFKTNFRWHNNPYTYLQSDYDKVLAMLFAIEVKRDGEHTRKTRSQHEYIEVPDSPIDKLIKLWNDILPHRQIKLEEAKVTVKPTEGNDYHGKEMSDGERMALYLAGQCLCLPLNSILIIDEPEMHLHKSLVNRLWTHLEEAQPTCLFVYITHDIDFAASRVNSRKIWLQQYDTNDKWIWDEVPTIEELPEALLLEIIGSRKKVLFTEGEKGSIDYFIYQTLYPEFFIVPCGSCTKVIESTKAIKDNPSLHHLDAQGIIDTDYRTEKELNSLTESGIFHANVAEIENIFCVKEVIEIIAKHQGLNEQEKYGEVVKCIMDVLANNLDCQISTRTALEIQFKLSQLNNKPKNKTDLLTGCETLIKSINIEELYKKNETLYKTIIKDEDLTNALRFYNNKGLPKIIAKLFGFAPEGYIELIHRLLQSDLKKPLIDAFKKYMPKIKGEAEEKELEKKTDMSKSEAPISITR